MNWRELTEWHHGDTIGETIKERDAWSRAHLPQVRTWRGVGYLMCIKTRNGQVEWWITSLGFFTTDSGWSCTYSPDECEIVHDPTANPEPVQLSLFGDVP